MQAQLVTWPIRTFSVVMMMTTDSGSPLRADKNGVAVTLSFPREPRIGRQLSFPAIFVFTLLRVLRKMMQCKLDVSCACTLIITRCCLQEPLQIIVSSPLENTSALPGGGC